mmetsp:Transcript_34719/g.87282  ORF Transcript_34719/g.87282 Transcript_34719/m.87282 type:complete len:235 (-) Transcript_34719:3471-4175(-)
MRRLTYCGSVMRVPTFCSSPQPTALVHRRHLLMRRVSVVRPVHQSMRTRQTRRQSRARTRRLWTPTPRRTIAKRPVVSRPSAIHLERPTSSSRPLLRQRGFSPRSHRLSRPPPQRIDASIMLCRSLLKLLFAVGSVHPHSHRKTRLVIPLSSSAPRWGPLPILSQVIESMFASRPASKRLHPTLLPVASRPAMLSLLPRLTSLLLSLLRSWLANLAAIHWSTQPAQNVWWWSML